MARTINEIYGAMLADKASRSDLDGLTSTSRVAVWSNLFWIVAAIVWTLEVLFDKHKAEVADTLANLTPGKAKWYRQLALDFRLGQNLDSNGNYDDTGLTETQIADMKIIKYASVTEIDGKLRMKVAKQVANKPVELTTGVGSEMIAFASYIEQLKYAGVKIIKDSLPPDSLKLEIDIWFNPLVLRSDGQMVDGSAATPVPDGIESYLNDLPFNGEYANTRLVDYLQKLPGVVLPVIRVAQAKYGLFPFTSIDEKYIPDAGYLEITTPYLTINYREYV